MNLELLKHAKGYIEKMANGINPLTGETIPDEELLNNIRISRCLFYVNDILGEVLNNGGITNTKTSRTHKIPFSLNIEVLKKYSYSEEDLSISKITQRINNLKQDTDMSNLKATTVCEWLISMGLMTEVDINGKKRKIPTDEGIKMGMYVEHRIGLYSNYDIVLYPRQMQEFIIDNFNSLLEFINK